jgi:dGTPase
MQNYAVNKSIGRLYTEQENNNFSAFELDKQKLVNSTAFRRLQYKTQVFVNHQGDHYRTRLTHSLEVAQISRLIASGLKLNQDLAENIALAHDLGHPPFGHAGEDALHSKMQNFGGFSHNNHTLKIITLIENYSPNFAGLNLSWEMLEGVAKHNGIINQDASNNYKYSYIFQYNKLHNLHLDTAPSLEAQVAAIADDIAYNNHDLEDGLRAGLFAIKDVLDLPMIGSIYNTLLAKNNNLKEEIIIRQAKKQITWAMIDNVINNTISRQPNNQQFVVDFDKQMLELHKTIKNFLHQNMYRHPLVNKMTVKAQKIVGTLFDFYFNNPQCLPEKINYSNDFQLAVAISDYIAGMTDRYAIKQYEEI